jgi:hypothetical protein
MIQINNSILGIPYFTINGNHSCILKDISRLNGNIKDKRDLEKIYSTVYSNMNDISDYDTLHRIVSERGYLKLLNHI